MPNEVNVVIDYKSIIDAIAIEINNVWQSLLTTSNEEILNEIKNIKSIEVSDEQSYIKKSESKSLRVGTVYIVIRFGSGTMNFGSTVSPVAIYCVGTANKVKPVQYLLGAFVSTWSTKNLLQGLEGEEEYTNKIQIWTTPEIVTNFNEIDNEFRNLYRINGSVVIGPAAVRVGTLTYFSSSGPVAVSVLSFQDGYRASLDSQPFGNSYGFAKSEVNFSTYTFTISTYLLDDQFGADILAIRGFRNRKYVINDQSQVVPVGLTSKFAPNDYMELKLEFTNGFTNMPITVGGVVDPTLDDNDIVKGQDFFTKFKVVDSTIGQELAGLPTLTVTFTR